MDNIVPVVFIILWLVGLVALLTREDLGPFIIIYAAVFIYMLVAFLGGVNMVIGA